MVELKPCPFCGGSDVRLRRDNKASMSWVSCVNCGLEAPTETGVGDESALSYWNCRAEALSRTGAVKVKPLEWGPYHNPVFAGPDIAVASFSVFGLQLYQAQRDPQGTGFIVFLAPKYGTEFWSSKGHADLDEAKAAAQADFDRRILSALEVTPPEGQQEAVTEALELARAVLAQSITAGHNVPGPTLEDTEKAFWALDAALKIAMEAGG